MYLVDSKKPFGDVHKLKNDNIDAFVTGETIAFEPSSTMMPAAIRSIFSYQRDKEPEREITMQCIDYVLTTRGGRACFNRPAHPVRSR